MRTFTSENFTRLWILASKSARRQNVDATAVVAGLVRLLGRAMSWAI